MSVVCRFVIIVLTWVVLYPAAASAGDDLDPKELKYKATFDAWHAKMKTEFGRRWAAIRSAEAKARPGFEAAKKRKGAKAEKALLKARATLFAAKNAALVPVNRGLSYEIAVALASIYEEAGKHALAKRELVAIEGGRPWMKKQDELAVFLHESAVAMDAEYRRGERAASRGNPPPRRVRKRTRHVATYLRYRHGKVWSEAGSAYGKTLKATAEKSEKQADTELYEDLGGTRRNQYHQGSYPATTFKVNDSPLIVSNGRVSKVKGSKAVLNYRKLRETAVNCKYTDKIRKITRRGTFKYHQKCDYKKKKGGHELVVSLPKGLEVKQGDKLTFFARVKKVKGKQVVTRRAAVVHVSRKGKTRWLLGVATKRPAHVKTTAAGFDLHVDENEPR